MDTSLKELTLRSERMTMHSSVESVSQDVLTESTEKVTNKIPAPDLDRIIQNVLLYADTKSMHLQEVLFESTGGKLYAYSCDDYVAVSDYVDFGYQIRKHPFSFSIEDLEAVGDWIKKDKKVVHKYDITIRPKMTGVIFECDDTSTDEDSDNFFIPDIVPSENWSTVFEVLNLDLDGFYAPDWAIRPERLVKLARIKAAKEAPIVIRGVELKQKFLVQFKKGSSIVGAIMPVDQSYVDEDFLWKK